MTEKLLTGTLSLNTNTKQKKVVTLFVSRSYDTNPKTKEKCLFAHQVNNDYFYRQASSQIPNMAFLAFLNLKYRALLDYLITGDICFFEVNTKHISSSELKSSEFSRVRRTSENSDVFNSGDEIYLVFT